MKKIFYFTMILSCIVGWKTYAQNLTVKGKIDCPDTLMILIGDGIVIDTLISFNKEFMFQRKMEHPELLTIVAIKVNSREYAKKDFFIEAGEVVIESSFKELNTARIEMSDTRSQLKYSEFRSRFDPLVRIARSIIDSSYVKGKSEAEKAVYRELYDRIVEVENEVAELFVRENTDNIVGAFVLANYLREMDPNKIEGLIPLFSNELLNSRYLLLVKDRMIKKLDLKEGNPSPKFSLKGKDGIRINLNDLLGKYTVLDFWGTWCALCIAGIPRMKEYHGKYADRVNFIGIACNDQERTWISAIRKYRLNWPQYLNSYQGQDLTDLFQIEAFPTKIILDDKGRIIKIFRGETEEFYNFLIFCYILKI